MSIPAALVNIRLNRLTGMTPAMLAGSQASYVLAYVAGRQMGRSGVIPQNTAQYDFPGRSTDPFDPWNHQVAVQAGEPITVRLEIWDDRGDDPPARLITLSGQILPPWQSGQSTLGNGPSLLYTVTTQLLPGGGQQATVTPRAHMDSSTGATLSPPSAIILELTDILGLYEPGYIPPGLANPRRAEYHPGYISHDDRGRIYINGDLNGNWTRDRQSIQLTVRVRVLNSSLTGEDKIRWIIIDPDDPGNDDPEVHQQWGSYIDERDYPGPNRPQGTHGGDNEGTADRNPVWEQVENFNLAALSNTEATTDIVSLQGESLSKVILHCPNVKGDNLIVRAEFRTSRSIPHYPAQTGILTMWERIDVEYIRMEHSFDLSVSSIPLYFERAYVQFDFAPQRVVQDRPFMAANRDRLGSRSSSYLNSIFTHKNQGGWYCLVLAMEPYPIPPIEDHPLYSGFAHLHQNNRGEEAVDIPGRHLDVEFVKLRWSNHEVVFRIDSPHMVPGGAGGQRTRCWLEAHDIQHEFVAGDGSLAKAYEKCLLFYPRGCIEGGNFRPGGYQMPSPVQVEAIGQRPPSGISPAVVHRGKGYFAGRTIVFTHHVSYSEEDGVSYTVQERDTLSGIGRHFGIPWERIYHHPRNRDFRRRHPDPNLIHPGDQLWIPTRRPRADFTEKVSISVVHELVHAFGMPHKCGYWNYRTPRGRDRGLTCCMNYTFHWMIDNRDQLVPDTQGMRGPEMCGRHLKEIRRVHLEDNPALGW
jgi:hypothetical protein